MNDRNLLLVEDDPQDEKLALRALAKMHIANKIDVTRDGPEALDYLFCQGQFSDRNPEEYPAVVLLDIRLPKLNGLEVLEQIRSDPRTRNLPVVLLTSSDDAGDVRDGYRLGANSYVRKPLDPMEFTTAVSQLGLYWLILNELPTD